MTDLVAQVNVGLLVMRATTLQAEGEAACHKVDLLGQVALKIEYTIERSEAELEQDVAGPFLPGAREELEKVRRMQRIALDETNAKLSEAKAILDRLHIENENAAWPDVLISAE